MTHLTASEVIAEIKEKIKFRQQFKTLEQWTNWVESPEGLIEILKDDWKAYMPDQFKTGTKTAEEILAKIRKRNEKH